MFCAEKAKEIKLKFFPIPVPVMKSPFYIRENGWLMSVGE